MFFSTKPKGNSMQGITVAKMSDAVMKFFGETIRKADETVQFVKRRSKLTGKLFVESLIVGCLSDDRICLERLCQLIKQRKVKITKQGLHQRFHEGAVSLLKDLQGECLTQFKTDKKEVIDRLKPFSSVNSLDSSGVSLPESLETEYKGFGGDCSSGA